MAQRASQLEGQQFGQLLALTPTDKRNHTKSIMWLCKCLACGEETTVSSTKLKAGEIKSCGCMEHVREVTTDPGETGCNTLYNDYRQGAKRRGLPFEISLPTFKQLTKGNCTYCGIVPSGVRYGSYGNTKEHGKYIFNGIDRVDSSIGYFEANCVSCCTQCNLAKGSRNSDEFLDWIKRVHNFTNS